MIFLFTKGDFQVSALPCYLFFRAATLKKRFCLNWRNSTSTLPMEKTWKLLNTFKKLCLCYTVYTLSSLLDLQLHSIFAQQKHLCISIKIQDLQLPLQTTSTIHQILLSSFRSLNVIEQNVENVVHPWSLTACPCKDIIRKARLYLPTIIFPGTSC